MTGGGAAVACAAAWSFLTGLALEGSAVDRLLAHEPDWTVPILLLVAGAVAWCAACRVIYSIVFAKEDETC